jgi:hypothetical protein
LINGLRLALKLFSGTRLLAGLLGEDLTACVVAAVKSCTVLSSDVFQVSARVTWGDAGATTALDALGKGTKGAALTEAFE